MKIVFALFVILFSGCQQKELKSSFADWQPPPVRPQVVVAQSDQILPPKAPRPTINYPMPKAKSKESLQVPRVKRIIVSIADQRLYAYGDDKETPLATFRCSTAVSGETYPVGYAGTKADIHNHVGEFTIDRKDIDHISGQYGCPMPYALHYYQGHWIHATEPNFYDLLGMPASHGCVRLRGYDPAGKKPNDAAWLYFHTPVGCRLTIR